MFRIDTITDRRTLTCITYTIFQVGEKRGQMNYSVISGQDANVFNAMCLCAATVQKLSTLFSMLPNGINSLKYFYF